MHKTRARKKSEVKLQYETPVGRSVDVYDWYYTGVDYVSSVYVCGGVDVKRIIIEPSVCRSDARVRQVCIIMLTTSWELQSKVWVGMNGTQHSK